MKPQTAIPVHGEVRHLHAHARLAKECQVPHSLIISNGALVRLAPGKAEVVDHVPSGRLAVDGDRLIPTESPVLRARRQAIFGGSAVVSLVVDEAGTLLAPPNLSARDLLDMEDEDDALIAAAVIEAVEDALGRLPKRQRQDDRELKEVARIAARRTFRNELGKKPLTDVTLVRVR